MRHFNSVLCAFCILALMLSVPGCKSLEEAARVAGQVIEENPELVKEKDRGKVLTGLKTVSAMMDEIDTQEEIAIGQTMAMRAFGTFGPPCKDPDVARYVAKVGKLVALQSDRPSLPFSFAVVENDAPNALALPGGYIFVTTGLLKRLRSEHELAAILGHEITHIAKRHNLEVILRDRRIASLVDFAQQMDKDVGQYRQFVDLSYDKLTHEGYDKQYEWAADLAGTDYAYRAGYHPEGLLPFLYESINSQGQMRFEVFKTHPDPAVRVAKIKEAIGSLGNYSKMPKLADRYQREALARLTSAQGGL